MASSLIPAVIVFSGENQIFQGVDWKRTMEFTNELGAPFSLAAYRPSNGGAVWTQIVAGALIPLATADGSVVLTFIDDFNLEIWIPHASSAADAIFSGANMYILGRVASGLFDVLVKGSISMEKNYTTSLT